MSGFSAVASYLKDTYGRNQKEIYNILLHDFNLGLRKKNFNALIEKVNLDEDIIPKLIKIYREHKPKINLYPDAKIKGVDISHRAIELARQMNPGLFFEQRDIIQTPLNFKWSVVTLLEVLEHIPPDKVQDFMSSITEMTVPGGHVIITVPHRNEKMPSKHYQHFEPSQLFTLIADDYDNHQFILFDHTSLFLKILLKLMGGSGKYFIVTWQRLTDLLFNYYMKRYLYGDSEKSCKKIACAAQKKSA